MDRFPLPFDFLPLFCFLPGESSVIGARCSRAAGGCTGYSGNAESPPDRAAAVATGGRGVGASEP